MNRSLHDSWRLNLCYQCDSYKLEIIIMSVINWPRGAVAKLNAIVKICKYRKIHERHHFIPMTMEVHDALWHDIDCFINECAHLFHNRRSSGHLFLSFYIQVFKKHFNIVFQHVYPLLHRERLVGGDACFRLSITIRCYNLHVGDMKRDVGDIVSYHKVVNLSPFYLGLAGCVS